MNLVEIVSAQREFDKKHGWTPHSNDAAEVCTFLARDLIGLFGEMGEFANIVKKLQLEAPSDMRAALAEHAPHLKEELVDFLIYVLRFAAHLELDLERAYLEKLSLNETRFRRFLRSAKTSDEGSDREPE